MRDSPIIQVGSASRSYSPAKIEKSLERVGGSEKAKWDACYYNFIKNAYFINSSNQSSSGDFFGSTLQPLFVGYYEVLSRFLSSSLSPPEKAEFSKTLDDPMRCILALMALGLSPREGASKKIDSHISDMMTKSGWGRTLAVPAFAANDLRHVANKELQKISQKSLARYPYELLRASIYFEIQRIESCSKSNHDPAAEKSRELREVMHRLDRFFNSGLSSVDNYNLLKSSALLPGKDLYRDLNRQRPSYGVGLFWNRLFRLEQTRSLTKVLNFQQRIDTALWPTASPAGPRL